MSGRSRNGSALLIVLGMMSFVMVSALAFAAYMRFARLPSSYLRRTSSSRMLVKAALAEAIDDLDMAIGNNPHPGVGVNEFRPTPDSTRDQPYNTWQSRVFMRAKTLSGDKFGRKSAQESETVTPLCLEALAYMPPPLVNEARYFSRYTETAKWQTLDFDSGRFCYCALDVSDYFDVNRLLADSPRASSPGKRVSLAYLFENDSHTQSGSGAQTWDNFVNQFRNYDTGTLQIDFKGKEPFVSIADLNLAIGDKGSVANFKSPFCEYIRNGGAGAGFYNTSSDADEDNIRRMSFVTDGWFPSGSASTSGEGESSETYDINDGENQPFPASVLENTSPSLVNLMVRTVASMPSANRMGWPERLSGLGCAALYDYLDADHVPVSLAIPTTERVPMVCAIMPQFTAEFGLTRKYEYESTGGTPHPNGNGGDGQPGVGETTRTVQQKVTYIVDNSKFLRGFMTGSVKALTAFPFSHKDPNDGSFSLDGRFSLFLTEGDVTMRSGPECAEQLFANLNPMMPNSGFDASAAMVNVKLDSQGIPASSSTIDTEEKAINSLSCSLAPGQAEVGESLARAGQLLVVTFEWTQTAQAATTGGVMGGREWAPKWDAVKADIGGQLKVVDARCSFPAQKWAGGECRGLDPEMSNATKLKDFLNGKGAKQVTLRSAVWLRVKNGEGKTVDLVPASFKDDARQRLTGSSSVGAFEAVMNDKLGRDQPLMLFKTGVAFNFSIEGLDALCETAQPVEIEPKSVMVADPRFNHAPEHWFKVGGEISESEWVRKCHASDNDRDGDIFMATSDAGYMQSPWEIAHLPRFTNLRSGDDGISGNYRCPDAERRGDYLEEGQFFAADSNNSKLMWRTFDPFDADADAFEELPWSAEGTGFKVNPYSDSTNVLMAAFANTPMDWKRASTNDVEYDYATLETSEFNKKWAWNEHSGKSEAKFAWKDLEAIAGRFSSEVRSNPERGWKDAWGELDWYGDEDHICGVTLSSETDPLWTADRKFLYGFWRDCFAARQQLFLVFVRAEPMMMGSGVIGQTPPQLGARAVALVWRDPMKTKDNQTPHKTRVLFYRQFD